MSRSVPIFATTLAFAVALSGLATLSQEAKPTSTPDPTASACALPGVDASAESPASAPWSACALPRHIIVPEDTLIRLTTDRPVRTKEAREGMPVFFTVSEDVVIGQVVAIPRGSTVQGEVVENKKGGLVHGAPEMIFRLDSLELGGKQYPLYAYEFKVQGVSKSKPSLRDLEGGAVMGALAGSVVAGTTNSLPTRKIEGEDMAAGAAAGAGAVATASAVGPRPVIFLPAESQMDFYLASPISVEPVDRREAERLGLRVHVGNPVLYVRGTTP